MAIDLESQEILEVVSEALRAGPGTAAWQRAMERVRALGGEVDGGELGVLREVREHLESGRRWREIRPGAGFTRKVMQAVEEAGDAKPRSTGPATVIAIVSGLLVVVVVIALVWAVMVGGGSGAAGTGNVGQMVFPTVSIDSSFDGAIGGEWRTLGTLPVEGKGGLRVSGEAGTAGGVGGVVTAIPYGAEEPIAVEAKVKAGAGVVQVFVADGKEAGARELVCQVSEGKARVVLPDGTVAGEVAVAEPGAVRVVVAKDGARVEVGGKAVWTGVTGLSPTAERWVGVRFVAKGKGEEKEAVVESLKVMKGAKAG